LAAVPKAAPAPVAESAPWEPADDEVPEATAPVVAKPAQSQKAEDILAMIRNRQNKQ